jgi:hypothetical protein
MASRSAVRTSSPWLRTVGMKPRMRSRFRRLGAVAAGDLDLGSSRPQVALDAVVGERHGEIVGEAEDLD